MCAGGGAALLPGSCLVTAAPGPLCCTKTNNWQLDWQFLSSAGEARVRVRTVGGPTGQAAAPETFHRTVWSAGLCLVWCVGWQSPVTAELLAGGLGADGSCLIIHHPNCPGINYSPPASRPQISNISDHSTLSQNCEQHQGVEKYCSAKTSNLLP